MHPLPLTEGKLLVDNSFLSCFTTCPRQAFYKYILRRQLIKPRAALFYGGAIHKALEVRDRFQLPIVTLEIENAMIDALIAYYTGVDFDNDYRNLDYAIETIKRYNTAWKFDQNVAINLPTGQCAVELPFAIPLGTITTAIPILCCDALNPIKEPELIHTWPQSEFEIVFTGKIDRLCDYQGAYWLLDHKTTSIGGPTFFSEFYTSLQFRGYKFAGEQILGAPISGVLINAIIARKPKADGSTNYTFERQPIPIAQSLIQEWKHTFLKLTRNWLNMLQESEAEKEQAFPIHTGSCFHKYGQCEYFEVCQLPVDHRATMLSTQLFEDHSWSPLEDGAKPKPLPEADLSGLWD